VHLLMLVLFVGWTIYFGMVLVKFRRKANPKADYTGVKNHFSTYIEIGVAVVEAVLLIGLAIPLWARAVDRFPTEAENPLEIQVMGQQFAWNAHFAGPDGKWGRQEVKFATATNPFGLDPNDPAGKDDVVTISNEPFLIPINRPVICKIGSMDVIHCFKLTKMRVTQDAIPGMSIPVHFVPTKVSKGEKGPDGSITDAFEITCAQLCGSGHSKMRGTFKVVTQEEFDKWFADKAKSGGAGGFE
jgi:cytochrome c oxidase subunit 2